MPSRRHHYIPVFYLRQWAGADGRICQFSRRNGHIVPKRKHPSGTGYQDNLYAAQGITGPAEQWLEDVFLRIADQEASDAIQELLAGNTNLPPKLRIGWTRFIMTLFVRTPDKIAWVRSLHQEEIGKIMSSLSEYYDEEFADAAPEKKNNDIRHEVEIAAIKLLQNVMDMPNVGNHIIKMVWTVYKMNDARFDLLTSDRPVVMTHPLNSPECQIGLPISPDHLFVATNRPEVAALIAQQSANELTRISNVAVSNKAAEYVYGTTDRQRRFVEKHFPVRRQ